MEVQSNSQNQGISQIISQVIRQRVGVIGGGQLAWMMAIAAKSLNISLAVQAASKDESAAAIADHLVLGKIDDFSATEKLAEFSDVITFENEFVDIPKLQRLASKGIQFLPQLSALQPLIDKYTQKAYLQQHAIPTPKFYAIASETDLLDAANSLSYPVILKARRHGYDGKGTCLARSEQDLIAAWASMGKAPAILEECVNFVTELAVMVARATSGECVVYPVVETQQVNQVCQRAIAPARVDNQVKAQIQSIAQAIVTHLDAVGIFGIEFFLTAAGEVSVNEIAPRTHNSGHYTIEACHTSQFEQLLRVLIGMPLGNVTMTTPVAVMVNLLGYETAVSDYADKRQAILQLPHTHLHWYGKNQAKLGRKLGHVTILAKDYAQAEAIADSVEQIWYGSN